MKLFGKSAGYKAKYAFIPSLSQNIVHFITDKKKLGSNLKFITLAESSNNVLKMVLFVNFISLLSAKFEEEQIYKVSRVLLFGNFT